MRRTLAVAKAEIEHAINADLNTRHVFHVDNTRRMKRRALHKLIASVLTKQCASYALDDERDREMATRALVDALEGGWK